MERRELKEKIRVHLVNYLTPFGYPLMSEQEILQHLKPMWISLEEAGLIQPGMTFNAFCEHATSQATFFQIRKSMGF